MRDGPTIDGFVVDGIASIDRPSFTIGQSAVVVLHGALAKRYGRRHRIGVRNAPEAAHALCRMVPGFEEDFLEGRYRVVRGPVKTGVTLTEAMLGLGVPDGGEIHFIPQARGGKHAGGGKMILGAVILVAAVALSYGAALAAAAPEASVGVFSGLGGTVFSGLGVTYGQIAFFGATMFISGIASLLSQTGTRQTADPRASFGLSGNTNSTTEGSVLPVVYGRVRVGSVVGSFGYAAEDYDPSAPAAATAGSSGTSGAIGGGGGGKGGGGSSGGAREASNTLQSRAIVRVIDILSEGPIGGLFNGAASIYFNNTPLMAADGSYNFQGVTWEMRLGFPDQTPVAGFSAAEQTSQVNTQVQNGFAGPIIRTYTSTTATAIRVTMQIPALYHQSPDNGDIQTFPSLEYVIEVRAASVGAWQQVVDQVFTNQKCTSPYQISHRFALPGAGAGTTSWDVRVRRITADPTTTNDQCSTVWLLSDLITDQPLSYPNVAYIALTIDAAAFGSQIPTRSYEIEGMVCALPANYDPIARTYATSGPGTQLGTWDGYTFTASVTNNPAWCCFDFMTNARYGLGMPSATVMNYTKFDLYPIAQYCDGVVPSGFNDVNGNPAFEFRYELNLQINTQVDAYRAIQAFVSSFRGMTYWGSGRVVITADMPTYPTTLTSQANVIDGAFTYEGASLKSRHTVAKVSWLDPQNSYQEAVEVVEDFDAVVSLGQISTEIVAFGCTSRGLAKRWGKWLLDTERHQTELVSYGVGLEHLRVRPGDVTRIADPAYAGVRMGGRCRGGSTTTSVVLDAQVVVGPGLSYMISVSLPDGTIGDRIAVSSFSTVTVSNNTYSVAHLGTALALAPAADASWVLVSAGASGAVQDRQFRILALAEPQPGQYQVSGVFHDPNKYARVEYGIQFDPAPYSTLAGLLVAPLPAPTNVSAFAALTGVGTTTILRTTICFSPATDPRVVSTQVQAVGPETRTADAGSGTTVIMDSLQLGTYTFQARSVGRDGRTSIWSLSPNTVLDGSGSVPDAPTGFTAQGGALMVHLNWTLAAARNVLAYEIWRAPSLSNGTHPFPSGFSATGSPAVNNGTLLATIQGSSFNDAGGALQADTGWIYWIRTETTTHQYSAFAGPVVAVTSYYLTDNLEQGIQNTAPIAQALLGSAPAAYQTLTGQVGAYDGQLALQASDSKLYRWNASANGGAGGWSLYIAIVPNSLGQIADASIAAVDATKIQGAFTSAQANSVIAAISAGEITDTMISGLAGAKVSGQLSNATMQAGRIYDVDPVTGATVVGVDTAKLLGQIGNTQITDGSVTTQKVAANAIVAGNIAAGAITSNKLSIAGPGNVIGNPCCPATAWGWNLASAGSVSGSFEVGSVTGDGYASPSYALAGEGSGVLSTTGTIATGGASLQAYWDPDGIGGVQCNGGDWWEAQAYLGCLRCYGRVALQFYDSSGNFLSAGEVDSSRVAGLVGGSTLSAYSFTWTKAQAPSNAVRVRMAVEALNDNGSDIAGGTPGSNPYLFFTRTVLAPSTSTTIAQGAQPQAYTIGGVTQVVGGAIKTSAITARQISAGAIDATKLSVGSVSSVITNSCCTVAASSWASSGAVSAVPLYSTWQLSGYGTGQIVAGLAASAFVDTSWAPDGGGYKPDGTNIVPWAAAVSCEPGQLWEAQAQVITSQCDSELMVAFVARATDGTWQVAATFTTGAQAWSTPANGLSLANYNQQSIRGTAPGPGTYGGKSCPAGATLVTLLLRTGNGAAASGVFGSGSKNATHYFTQTALGIAQTASAPMTWSPGGSTQIDGSTVRTGTIVAGALAAGSVTASNIVSASITGAQIAAGTITASNLAIGSATNLCWNACPDQGTDGWTIAGFGSIGTIGDGANVANAASLVNGNYRLAGTGSGFSQFQSGALVQANQGHLWDWNPSNGTVSTNGGYGIPVQAGATYGAAAYLIAGNNATAYVQMIFLDFYGTVSTISTSSYVHNNDAGGGVTLSQYTRVSLIAVAPANAVTCILRIVMQGANGGAAYPYMAFTQAQIGPMPAGSTAIGDWQPGGVTTISGGMIKTNSILANRIASQSLTSNQIAAGSVGADRLVANSITAGQIQAGAIGASQIAAGSLYGYHLAANFALINSAQIGTATIVSANIQNLAVGNQQLNYGSVTILGQSLNFPNAVPGSSYQPAASVSITVNDGNNRGALVSFLYVADGGGSYQGQTFENGSDSGGGGTITNYYQYGDQILLRHYFSNFDGSGATYDDLYPSTGLAVNTASGTYVPGYLADGNHTWTLYHAVTGQSGTTCHVANLVIVSLSR